MSVRAMTPFEWWTGYFEVAEETRPPVQGDGKELLEALPQSLGREGMVTVWSDYGEYLGCMGAETWSGLLGKGSRVDAFDAAWKREIE